MIPQHHLPADIERTSMQIIAKELEERHIRIPRENLAVVKRVIHTTADFEYAETLHFTEDAVQKAIEALHNGATIITDTNMALAGVSKPGLKKLNGEALCFMADPAVAQSAKESGTTLFAIAEEIENGLRPALVIGVPVGFVNVIESKENIFAVCEKHHVPTIVAFGRKGGSTIAAAVCNALIYSAAEMLDPTARGWK